MIILIDNGHGVNTSGKCSPDKSLREYAYCREIASRLVCALKDLGYDARRIVTEEIDISLSERCRRVNKICREVGSKNCLCVSIHNNAAGSQGKWLTARGWSVFVGKNASQNSKRLADDLHDAAKMLNQKIRVPDPSHKYWTQNLAMCRDTLCPAVLTENLFQDNLEDVKYLLSEEGKAAMVQIHLHGIINYINGK